MTTEKAEPGGRAERLRLELEKIAWMDEFLDASGAKAMMQIARDAVRADETRAAPARRCDAQSEAVAHINTRLEDLETANAVYGKDTRLEVERNNREISWLKDLRSIIALSETKPAQTRQKMTPCKRCGKLINDLLHEDDADFRYCYECFDEVIAEREMTEKIQQLTAQGGGRSEEQRALRDIISIAKDAQATDALGDIVKRAEEGLGND